MFVKHAMVTLADPTCDRSKKLENLAICHGQVDEKALYQMKWKSFFRQILANLPQLKWARTARPQRLNDSSPTSLY